MNGQERLFIVALVVSILVIIGLAIVFSFLFFLYSFYKVKHINLGFEDKQLKKEYKKKIFTINSKNRTLNIPFITCKEMIKDEEKLQKKLHVLMDVFAGVIIVFLIGLLGVGISYRAQGDQIYINNTTYLTILTGSMEEKHEDNSYLIDNNLNNQIIQYSLVGIDKVNSEEDIELYDVLAYKHDDIIILHRVVEIKSNEDNETIYTLRGDSNNASLSYEKELKFEDFIGKYNGFQNYGAGVFITYIKSEIGLIALSSAFVFIFLATIAEERINKSYKNRLDYFIVCPHNYSSSSSSIFYFDEDDENNITKDVVINENKENDEVSSSTIFFLNENSEENK